MGKWMLMLMMMTLLNGILDLVYLYLYRHSSLPLSYDYSIIFVRELYSAQLRSIDNAKLCKDGKNEQIKNGRIEFFLKKRVS